MVATTPRCTRAGGRLHVHTGDGRPLGWYDLRTGATTLLDPDPGAAAEVQACLDAYAAATSPLRRRRVDTLATRPDAPRRPGTRPSRTAAGDEEARQPSEDLRDRFPGEHVTRLLLARLAPEPDRPRRARTRDPLGPALRHAHQAALGQQQVGRVLAGLSGWHVLHSVPASGRSWLDHLLVGPGGVVVLRTAAHPGDLVRVTGSLVRVGGRPVSHVRLLRAQLRTVAERLRPADLPVPVRGVVVTVGARSVRAAGLPAGVSVLRLQDLTGWLADLPTVLSRVDVLRLREAAARPGTWPQETDAVPGPAARQRRREQERDALARLTVRARDAARLRRTRRALLLAGGGTGGLVLLAALQPDVLPQAVSAVGMIGG